MDLIVRLTAFFAEDSNGVSFKSTHYEVSEGYEIAKYILLLKISNFHTVNKKQKRYIFDF